MIPGGFLLLIGMLVLLIHDDQAERFHRREHRRPGADDDARPALADFFPFIVPLPRREVTVQHRPRAFAPGRS